MDKSIKSFIKRIELKGLNAARQAESKIILKYNNTVDGYVKTTSSNLIKLVTGDANDYFKYLAGERTHIYPEYDELRHEISIGTRSPEFMVDHGIPFCVYDLKSNTTEDIPFGLYKMQDSTEYGFHLKKMSIISDDFIDFRKNKKYDIYEEILKFKNSKDTYKKMGVRHKGSMLLYGPPGNSKTRSIIKVLENAHKDNIICIFITSDVYELSLLESFRVPLKDKFVIFIIEELTERTSDKFSVEELLSFLDGEMSWDNCYVIATTNHPEMLPANIVDRPGRFGKLIEFPLPDKEERTIYLKARGIKDEELEEAVNLSQDMSVDYLAQSVTQSKLNNVSITDYLKESKKTKDLIQNSFKRSKFGIGE